MPLLKTLLRAYPYVQAVQLPGSTTIILLSGHLLRLPTIKLILYRLFQS